MISNLVTEPSGIDRRREESKVSESGNTTIPEDAANPFYLSGRKAVSFANLQAFVPDLPFRRDFFLQCHRFHPFSCFRPLLHMVELAAVLRAL
jgi:hypothetical protein